VVPLYLFIGLTACHLPPNGDRSPRFSPEVTKGQDREPGWTIGWSALKAGMDGVEVLSLLGEPRHVKVTKINTIWYYSDRLPEGPRVVFDTRRMRVDRWQPPASR
jgi:hypothetical protein